MTDRALLSRDVRAIFEDWDNQFFMSVESVKELIVGFNNKRLCSKRWKTAIEMIEFIKKSGLITIVPITEQHMLTYAQLQLNEAQGHKDPSDHVIIAQAITEHIPLISSDTRFPFYREQGLDLVFNEK
ncbi:MAG: PIN domain-containing protein [Paludibacteraceae bacterium]|nr:PIN domain-containing protein [Paludibacteraceae bacterium]